MESEIDHRKVCRDKGIYNPNIINKCGIEYLTRVDPSLILSTSTLLKEVAVPCRNRSPAPLPKSPSQCSDKSPVELTKPLVEISVDSGTDEELSKEAEESPDHEKDLNYTFGKS